MGLDISHRKLTFQEPEYVDAFNDGRNLLDQLNHFKPDERSYVTPFIQPIKICVVKDRIWYAKTETQFHKFQDSKISLKNEIIFEPDLTKLKSIIFETEKAKGLTSMAKYETNITDWNTISYYEFEIKEGFYSIYVGGQRKGVNKTFAERFMNNGELGYYMALEDFMHAYHAIDFYWDSDTDEDVENRRELFRKNFINKYVKGESYLSVSY
jgi:hypothetical protein